MLAMGYLSLFFISIGLCFDTFAVSVSCGLLKKKIQLSHAFRIACIFAVVQGVMPFLGWLLGQSVEPFIADFDHWVAFTLLGLIGAKMIYESFKPADGSSNESCDCMSLKTTFGMAIATSIDALIIGMTLAFIQLDKVKLMALIMMVVVITGAVAIIGIWVGKRFGHKFERQAGFLGGALLVLIGTKVLLEHTAFAG